MSTYKRLPRDKKNDQPIHVATLLDHAYHHIEHNWRKVLVGAAVLAVIVASVLSLRYYLGDRDDKAKALYFEATKAAQGSEDAIKKFDELIKQYPSSGVAEVARIKLALVYSGKGDFAKAEESIVPATKASDDVLRSLAFNNLAEVKLAAGKPQEAADVYVKAANDKKNPMRGASYFNAALAYKEAGNVDEAKKILTDLVKEDADYYTPELAEKSRQMLLYMASNGK